LIGVQDADSCGRSSQCETPQERSDERLTSHPRKAKSCTEINSDVHSRSDIFPKKLEIAYLETFSTNYLREFH
jgi:hypothetical protein